MQNENSTPSPRRLFGWTSARTRWMAKALGILGTTAMAIALLLCAISFQVSQALARGPQANILLPIILNALSAGCAIVAGRLVWGLLARAPIGLAARSRMEASSAASAVLWIGVVGTATLRVDSLYGPLIKSGVNGATADGILGIIQALAWMIAPTLWFFANRALAAYCQMRFTWPAAAHAVASLTPLAVAAILKISEVTF